MAAFKGNGTIPWDGEGTETQSRGMAGPEPQAPGIWALHCRLPPGDAKSSLAVLGQPPGVLATFNSAPAQATFQGGRKPPQICQKLTSTTLSS